MDVVQHQHQTHSHVKDEAQSTTHCSVVSTYGTPIINVQKWLFENRDKFLPPVSNFFMHNGGQLTVMFVAGPNNRTDYHIQHGEEFFYQLRGDMLLKTMVQGKPRDIVIREGEILLLPKRIPHSPQRFADTMGIVLERKRTTEELDVLRFYTSKKSQSKQEILYQDSFHWSNVSTDMVDCLKKYGESEQCKNGEPIPNQTIETPLEVNETSDIQAPFSLFEWIHAHENDINANGKLEIYDTTVFRHKIYVFGQGKQEDCNDEAQTWLYQLTGESKLAVEDQTYKLGNQDSILLPVGVRFQVVQQRGSYLLSCCQCP